MFLSIEVWSYDFDDEIVDELEVYSKMRLVMSWLEVYLEMDQMSSSDWSSFINTKAFLNDKKLKKFLMIWRLL